VCANILVDLVVGGYLTSNFGGMWSHFLICEYFRAMLEEFPIFS
jgi:hypothetical protein